MLDCYSNTHSRISASSFLSLQARPPSSCASGCRMACTDPQQQGLKKMLQQTTYDEHSTNTAQSHHNHLALHKNAPCTALGAVGESGGICWQLGSSCRVCQATCLECVSIRNYKCTFAGSTSASSIMADCTHNSTEHHTTPAAGFCRSKCLTFIKSSSSSNTISSCPVSMRRSLLIIDIFLGCSVDQA